MKIILLTLLAIAVLALLFFCGMFLFFLLRQAFCDIIDFFFYDILTMEFITMTDFFAKSSVDFFYNLINSRKESGE